MLMSTTIWQIFIVIGTGSHLMWLLKSTFTIGKISELYTNIRDTINLYIIMKHTVVTKLKIKKKLIIGDCFKWMYYIYMIK